MNDLLLLLIYFELAALAILLGLLIWISYIRDWPGCPFSPDDIRFGIVTGGILTIVTMMLYFTGGIV